MRKVLAHYLPAKFCYLRAPLAAGAPTRLACGSHCEYRRRHPYQWIRFALLAMTLPQLPESNCHSGLQAPVNLSAMLSRSICCAFFAGGVCHLGTAVHCATAAQSVS